MPARSFYPAVVLVWVCMMGVLFGASLIYERYPILRNTGAEKQLVPYMFLPSLLIALLVMNLMLFGKPLTGLARRDLWITGIFWVMASLTFGVLIQRLLDPSDSSFLLLLAFVQSNAWYVLLIALFLFPPMMGNRYLK